MISSWEKILFFIDTDEEVNIKHSIIKRRIQKYLNWLCYIKTLVSI